VSAAIPARARYGIAAILLFAIEVLIALFVRDAFIRPYLGDVLAVALVYTILRAITPLGNIGAALAAFALAIEIAQAMRLLDMVGLADNALARTVLGGSFDWLDLAAYAAGAVIALAADAFHSRRLS
jgi:hypothetical protein